MNSINIHNIIEIKKFNPMQLKESFVQKIIIKTVEIGKNGVLTDVRLELNLFSSNKEHLL